jgi:hypothetical protein
MSPMKMAGRLLLCMVAISIGLVTPMQPDEPSTTVVHKTNCCTTMNMSDCRSCPINTSGTNSGSGSTCCTGQTGCLPLYVSDIARFVAGIRMIGKVGINDERGSARTLRPPVPPPRIAFS